MISAVRNLSKSTIGTLIMILFLLMIVASFALQDMSSTLGGSGFGSNRQTLAKVGGEEIAERDLSAAMQRRLTEIRQQDPAADYAALAGDFDPMLASLIGDAAIRAFAADQGIVLSKRLVDAEIANIPATRGLDGKFSDQAYQIFLQQQRLSDGDLRRLLSGALLQRLVLAPASASARVPVGMATPYASVLLESREADVALIPTAAFTASVPEPGESDIAAFYRANGRRYLVPEQRVLGIARIGPEQVAKVAASDKEIADFYNANKATYGGKSTRVISQAVVPSKQAADAIAARARGGASFVEAARPAGLSAEDISIGPQSREEFTELTSDKVAAAAFAAASNAVVGPIRSDLGWHVVKIDSIRAEPGRSLTEARDEIATRLSAEKRTNALADLVAKVEDAIVDGSSFAEAVAAAGLSADRTPLVTSNGESRAQPEYKLPPELAPALRAGFDLAQDDDPVVETLDKDNGYALVGVERIVSAAPAPLASIRARVIADWKDKQASDKAKAVAGAIVAKVAKGMDFKAAVASAGIPLPPPRRAALQRLQLAQMGGNVPPALGLMFSMAEGRSRMIADREGRGFIIVKVTKIVPGNATLQPSLVSRTQSEFQEAAGSEYAEQFNRAIAAEVGVKRNESAITEARKRILGGGG